MYKLTVFVPSEAKESVKAAIFGAGAGRLGNYDSCCFELRGTGQFRALEGSQPTLGQQNELESVDETRLECVVSEQYINDVIAALKNAHPYETPAYDVIKMEQF